MRYRANGITVEQQNLPLGDGYRRCIVCGRRIKSGRIGSVCKAKSTNVAYTARIKRICNKYVERCFDN